MPFSLGTHLCTEELADGNACPHKKKSRKRFMNSEHKLIKFTIFIIFPLKRHKYRIIVAPNSDPGEAKKFLE